MKSLPVTISIVLALGLLTHPLFAQWGADNVTFTISGNTGVGEVELKGFPSGVVKSDSRGFYATEVRYTWTGKIVAIKEGYNFDPPSLNYNPVKSDLTGQDFTPSINHYTISGVVRDQMGPVEGALVLSQLGSAVKSTTDCEGRYELRVLHGWSGPLVVVKEGYDFTSCRKQVANVMRDMTFDFVGKARTCKIIGEIVVMGKPVPGIQMTATNGGSSDTTDARGRFCVEVPYNWSGEIIPTKDGWAFDPPSKIYDNVMQDIDETRPSQGRVISSEPVDVEPIKPNVLMIPTAQKSKPQLDAMCEDIQVMSHLLYQAVQGKHSRIGGVFREYGSLLNRDCLTYDAMYIEGTGVIFFLLVDYQFERDSDVFKPTMTQSDADAVWNQARQQLSQPIAPSDSDTWQSADEVINEVLKVLKHAVNIRGLGESEGILVVLNPDQGIEASSLVLKIQRSDIEAFESGEMSLGDFREKVKVLSY